MKFKNLSILAILFATAALGAGRIQNEDVKSQTDLQSANGTITGNLSSGSACIASPSSTAGLAAGQYAYDSTTPANIASGTTITAIPGTCSAGQIQLSANAAGTGTGDTITFGGQVSQLINDTKVYVTANSINSRLDTAISSGLIGGSGGGGVQLLSNPGFEIGSTGAPPASWALSAATGTLSTANIYAGSKSELLTLSSQTPVLSQDVTPTQPLNGVNLEASCKVLTTQSTVQVCAREAGASLGSSYCTLVPSTGTWQYVPVNFVGPSSGSLGVQVTTTGSTTGTVYVDDCYVGPARNLSQVSQAQFLGSVTPVCSGDFTTTSTSYTDFSAGSGCTYSPSGSASAPSTNLLAIKFASLPPGNYLIEYEGYVSASVSGAHTAGGYFQFWDGTNTAIEQSQIGGTSGVTDSVSTNAIVQNITYATPQTNVTFSLRAKANSSATVIAGASVANPGVIKVYYYPTQSQLAITQNTSPGNYSATGAYSGTTASGTIADPSSLSGSITTSGTPQNISCSTSGSVLGMNCTLPAVGNYQVCYSGYATSTGTNTDTFAELTDGSNVIIAGPQGGSTSTLSTSPMSFGACANYTAASTSVAFKVRGSSGGGTATFYLSSLSVTSLSNGQTAPILAGGVTSNTKGQEHIESAIIGQTTTLSPLVACTTTPCLVASQSGSWLTGIVRNSTGNYTLSFASGEFSAAPRCDAWGARGSSQVCVPDYTSTASPTQVTIDCFGTATASATDAGFGVKCMGPH